MPLLDMYGCHLLSGNRTKGQVEDKSDTENAIALGMSQAARMPLTLPSPLRSSRRQETITEQAPNKHRLVL